MNIQQLEYLVAVDKHRHFGRAAHACFITQPTLSAMIHKLEEELDLKIFDRTSHPIRTTDAGTEIVKHAKNVIGAVNELRLQADLLNNVLGGKMSLGIIPTVSTFLLSGPIFELLEEFPKIQLQVREMTTDNIIKSLKSGELDAGIIATPYDAAREFYSDHLFNEELMLYSSEQINKNETYVKPEDIDVEKVWLLEEGNCLRTQFENICQLKENSEKPHNLNYRAANINTLMQMVDKVGGISIIPELATKQLHGVQKNKVLRFRKPFPFREISIIYYKPTYKQRIIDQLAKTVRDAVQDILNYPQAEEDFVSIRPE